MPRALIPIAILFAATLPIQAGPAPYRSAKIYIVDSTGRSLKPCPEDIRKEPDIVIEVTGAAIVDWFASLHWEKHIHDTSIAERAKPLVMIIDLYHRVQPESPTPPTFDTLYCSSKYAYSPEGDYIDISRLASSVLGFPVLPLRIR
jgi:hypothetical protein